MPAIVIDGKLERFIELLLSNINYSTAFVGKLNEKNFDEVPKIKTGKMAPIVVPSTYSEVFDR